MAEEWLSVAASPGMDIARESSGVGSRGDPAAGARRPLGGRYQVLNEIGRGGMGRVYRVLDRRTGRVVTLKRVLMPLDLGDKDSREGRVSLAAEFRLLASLRHPNIISVRSEERRVGKECRCRESHAE